jgi:two-component system response regulator MtrA
VGKINTLTSPKKILVVDDDEDILEVVKIVLNKAGLEVSTHTTGLGILEKILHILPNLILLDIRLPGKSGTDVCKEVKEAFSIPILFFSAHAMEEKTYKECHADGFIKKPFDVNRLISEIKSHLD